MGYFASPVQASCVGIVGFAYCQRIAATPKVSAILQRAQASVVVVGTTQNAPLVNLAMNPVAIIYFDVAAVDGAFAEAWGPGGMLRYRAFDQAGSLRA